jgi:hypothetical protein
MKRLCTRLRCCCLALLLLPGVSRAAEVPPPGGAKTPQALLRQLGADDFAAREEAHRLLADMGRAAEAALREGVADDDPEVRRHAGELLARIRRTDLEAALDAFLLDHNDRHLFKLPNWSRFVQAAGDSDAARSLFLDMCTAEVELLSALDRDPKAAAALLADRCQELQKALFQPGVFPRQPAPVSLGQVAALLYVAADERVPVQPVALNQVYTLLYQPEPRQGLTNNAAARRLLVHYIEHRSDPVLIHQQLSLVQNYNLKECLPWVLKIAKAKDQQAYVRGTAITAVGRLGGKENIADLEPLLNDTTPLGQAQFNQVRISTELRDVALAMMVHLSGQPLDSYDFPYLKAMQGVMKANPNTIYFPPSWLGFSDNAGREAALKKWKDWVAAQKK